MIRSCSLLFVVVCLLTVVGDRARAEITLVGVAGIPGNSVDRSGLTDKLADGTPHHRFGGLSGIAYTGKGNEYVHVSDRGPKDGATNYHCRFHRMNVFVTPGATPAVKLELTETTLLKDAQGRSFVGALEAIKPLSSATSHRLDPEGVRLGRQGSLFISDEYGPYLFEFDAQGNQLRTLPIPKQFQPTHPSKNPAEEMPPKNRLGRQANRGMEGLAISPDGTKLFGILQSPLIQDNSVDQKNKRIGVNVRLLEIDLPTGKTRQFVYPLDDPANGINEIVAINDHEFLVLERDGNAGKEARYKRLNWIDVRQATDVSNVASLPTKMLPASIRPVKKRLFLDVLEAKFKVVGPDCPEKFEGLSFGPDLPDGRRLLLLTSDNDFVEKQPFRVYAFAIDKADLLGYVPQQFDATASAGR